MADEAQISADAELARRLQHEEMGGFPGLEGVVFGRTETRFPDRRPTQSEMRRAHEETRPDLRLLSQLGMMPRGGPGGGPSPDATLESFMGHFFASDGNFGMDAGDMPPREAPSVGPGAALEAARRRRLEAQAQAAERRRASGRGGGGGSGGLLPPELEALAGGPNARVRDRGAGGLVGELDAMMEMMQQPPGPAMFTSIFRGGSREGGGGGGGGPLGAMLRALRGGAFMGDDAGSFEEMMAHIERQGNVSRGATDAEIEALPTTNYQPPKLDTAPRRAGPGPSSAPPQEREKCAICLSEFEEGEDVKRLPCGHVFKAECVSRWLKVNKTCPMCKTSIRPGEGAS